MIFKRNLVPRRIESRIRSVHLAAFGIAWVAFFFILPLVFLVPESLSLNSGDPFQAYRRILDSLYIDAFIRSFEYALLTTALTLILAYTLSYFLSFATRRTRLALTLVVVPLWIAYIVRYFGLLLFFSPAGPLAQSTGISLDILFSTPAVIIGLANVYLPFAVLPIYNSLNAIDGALINSSRMLGAGRWRTIWSIIIPLSLPGVVAAGLIVFILAAGSFLGPAVLGGPGQKMVANFIASSFLDNFNIQFASALAVTYTIILLGLLVIFNSVADIEEVLGEL